MESDQIGLTNQKPGKLFQDKSRQQELRSQTQSLSNLKQKDEVDYKQLYLKERKDKMILKKKLFEMRDIFVKFQK